MRPRPPAHSAPPPPRPPRRRRARCTVPPSCLILSKSALSAGEGPSSCKTTTFGLSSDADSASCLQYIDALEVALGQEYQHDLALLQRPEVVLLPLVVEHTPPVQLGARLVREVFRVEVHLRLVQPQPLQQLQPQPAANPHRHHVVCHPVLALRPQPLLDCSTGRSGLLGFSV